MILALATVLWFASIAGAIWFVRTIDRKQPKTPWSFWCALWSALEALPVALAFSPTIVGVGMAAFPAPAIPVVLALALTSEASRRGFAKDNIPIATMTFLVCWLIAWILNYARKSRKLGARPVTAWMFQAGAITVTALVLLCLLGPCSPRRESPPTYHGP